MLDPGQWAAAAAQSAEPSYRRDGNINIENKEENASLRVEDENANTLCFM